MAVFSWLVCCVWLLFFDVAAACGFGYCVVNLITIALTDWFLWLVCWFDLWCLFAIVWLVVICGWGCMGYLLGVVLGACLWWCLGDCVVRLLLLPDCSVVQLCCVWVGVALVLLVCCFRLGVVFLSILLLVLVSLVCVGDLLGVGLR